jgi:endonuclease/exonuclease/phosphatase family metal-dependent hydrolase
VQTPSGVLRVYNAHLQSHSISPETESLLQAPLAESETWKGYRSVLGRVRHFTAMRAAQARWLADEIAQCPFPVIVAGDLNDTPQSYSYRILARDLKDSFHSRGRGFGTTFAGNIPGLRIDYILGGKGLQFTDHQVVRTPLSDHYPVSARFTLSE